MYGIFFISRRTVMHVRTKSDKLQTSGKFSQLISYHFMCWNFRRLPPPFLIKMCLGHGILHLHFCDFSLFHIHIPFQHCWLRKSSIFVGRQQNDYTDYIESGGSHACGEVMVRRLISGLRVNSAAKDNLKWLLLWRHIWIVMVWITTHLLVALRLCNITPWNGIRFYFLHLRHITEVWKCWIYQEVSVRNSPAQ